MSTRAVNLRHITGKYARDWVSRGKVLEAKAFKMQTTHLAWHAQLLHKDLQRRLGRLANALVLAVVRDDGLVAQ